ncbi:MAG: tripartite tricarboxylate transporter TctB family protein [Deltaproteobacteria bacterium]
MKNTGDVIGGFALCALSIAAGIGSLSLRIGSPTEPQSGFFPFAGSMLLFVFSVVIILRGLLGPQKEQEAYGEMSRPAALLLVLTALVAALSSLGYLVSTFVSSGLILRIMGVKSLRILVITGLCLSVGTYVLFDKLLGVELPVGFLVRFGL